MSLRITRLLSAVPDWEGARWGHAPSRAGFRPAAGGERAVAGTKKPSASSAREGGSPGLLGVSLPGDRGPFRARKAGRPDGRAAEAICGLNCVHHRLELRALSRAGVDRDAAYDAAARRVQAENGTVRLDRAQVCLLGDGVVVEAVRISLALQGRLALVFRQNPGRRPSCFNPS